MTRRLRTFLAVSLLATAGPVLSACRGPVDGPPPAAQADEYVVTLVAAVFDANGLPVHRRVNILIEVKQADGQYAWRTPLPDDIDPATGKLPADWATDDAGRVRQPIDVIRPTTWAHNATLGHGIVSAQITVTHLGQGGETVACWREESGVVLPGSRMTAKVPTGPIGGAGSATVTCLHLH